ncbi:MAG TPA: hypothetical protein VKE51_15640 [Vicinamibacterales bacterium]|nr:hypothetical protein [Vicinamibacterales bacterium]
MTDTRYKDQGYPASLLEEVFGAFLTIRRNGKIVAEVAIGLFEGGKDSKARVLVKRFQPNELREVLTVDDFTTD